MKIIIVGSAYPYRGGLAAYNERLAQQFTDEGHDVEIYTFSLQYPNIFFPGKTQYADGHAPKNLTIKRVVNAINPFSWIKTGQQIKKTQPDLLLFKYWTPFMAPCFGSIARIAKNKKTKIVTIVDNMIPHERHFYDKLLSKYLIKSIDAFVAMSQSVLNDIKLFTCKPTAFCPHPLFDNFGDPMPKSTALNALQLSEKFNYILFFGFIRNYKGLDLLIKAMADTRMAQYRVKLIVAGEFYEDEKPYLHLIEELKLQEDILLHTHFIPNEKVAAYFCAADIIAQPYKDATQSGVTQIGYHFVKPMLVTDVGGLAEIIPDGISGYVVNPDEHAIADALVDFFSHNKQDYFNSGIIEERKKYAWDNMTKTIELLINK